MNQYGEQLRRHWETYRPRELARIEDPEGYFAEQGEVAWERIAELARSLEARHAAETPPGSSFLANLGQAGGARATAESTVMREMLPPPEDEDTDETG